MSYKLRRFSESISNLYSIVNEYELESKSKNGIISINSKVYNEIRNRLNMWEFIESDIYTPILILYDIDHQFQCRIFEDDDEYYWVEFFHGGYDSACWKCDTKEGLFKLLIDKEIII